MVRAIHHKFHASCNLAELPDDELVADKVVMVRHMAFEFRVSDVGKIPDDDVRIFDGRLDVDFLVVASDGMNRIWIGDLGAHVLNIYQTVAGR